MVSRTTEGLWQCDQGRGDGRGCDAVSGLYCSISTYLPQSLVCSLLDVMRNACLFKSVLRISRNVDRGLSKLVIRSERTTDRSIATLHVAFLPRDDDVNFAQARCVNGRT